jgi:threonylcarbamoyladenosine tRNA methylthiotransferase MtaB
VADIIARVDALASSGIREIVLTGINVGAYLSPSPEQLDLAGLVMRLRDETDIHRIRVSSIEPLSVTSRIIELLADDTVLCEHLHIPLQSGSSRVLRDMNRPYTAEQYRALIADLRENCPDIALHTDVIVGYPTESDEDFEETLAFVGEIGFAGAHLFKFSARPGTVAAALEPLSPEILDRRFARLQQIVQRSVERYRHRRLASNRPLELLVERIDEGGMLRANSREHLTFSWGRLENPFPHAQVGDIVNMSEGGDDERLDRK